VFESPLKALGIISPKTVANLVKAAVVDLTTLSVRTLKPADSIN